MDVISEIYTTNMTILKEEKDISLDGTFKDNTFFVFQLSGRNYLKA